MQNMQLPEDFIRETRLLMGEERFNCFMEAFNEDAPVSIRLNPLKGGGTQRDGSFVTSLTMSQKNRPSVTPSTSVLLLAANPQPFAPYCPKAAPSSAMNRFPPVPRYFWKTSRNGAGPTASSPTTIPVTSARRRLGLTSSSATCLALVRGCSVRILPPSANGVYRMWRSVGDCNGKLSPMLGNV